VGYSDAWDWPGTLGARAMVFFKCTLRRRDASDPLHSLEGTTDEQTIRRATSRRPASLRDAARSRLNKEKRVCLRDSTLVNPMARDLNKSATLHPSGSVPLATKNSFFRPIYRAIVRFTRSQNEIRSIVLRENWTNFNKNYSVL